MSTRRHVAGVIVALLGCALWGLVLFLAFDALDVAVIMFTFLMIGPAWAYAFCWASREEDFPEDAWRDRRGWLGVLPWTFVIAPLLVPNLVLLVTFFRDSRADHGRTWLGSGRSNPGEGREEMLR